MATYNIKDFLKQAGGSKNDIQVLDRNAPVDMAPKDGGPNYFQRVGQQYTKAAQDITDVVTDKNKNLANAIDKANNAPNLIEGLKGFGETALQEARVGLRTVGAIAGSAFAPITELPGVKQSLEGIGTTLIKIPGVKDLVMNATKLAEQHPEIAKDIQNIVDIVSLGLGGAAEKAGKETVIKAGEKAAEVGSEVAGKTGKALKGVGEGAYKLSVPMEESTKIAQQAYEANQPGLFGRIKNFFTNGEVGTKPITEAETAARKGLTGTEWQLGVQAKKISGQIYQDIIQPKLQAVKGKVNVKEFMDNIEKDIIKNTKELGRRNTLLEALQSFKEDYKNVSKISLEKLQQYKEGWAKFLPDRVYKGKPIGSAFKEIQDTAAKKAREIIYKYIGEEGRQAYFDYGNLKSIEEAGRKAIDQLRTKSFTRQAWEFVLDNAVTPVTTFGGKVLYRTGQGLEFIGERGAKKVKDIIGK